jgi:hypothetical protein
MAGETREVKVRMSVDLGPDGDKAMRQLAESTKLAKAATEELKQVYRTAYGFGGQGTFGMPGTPGGGIFGQPLVQPPGPRPGSQPSGGGGAGMLGFNTGAFGRVFAGALAVGHLVQATTETARDVFNPYVTSGQAERNAFRNFAPFGGRVQDLVDALSGRTGRMQAADVQGRFGAAEVGFRSEVAGMQLGLNPILAGRSQFAGAFNRQQAVLPPVVDRTTGLGEREFREASRLVPLKQQVLQAERQTAAAVGERLQSQIELGKLEQRGKDLQTERFRIERRISQEQTGPERLKALRDMENLNQEVQNNANLQKQARQQVYESSVKEAQARGEVERTRIRADLIGRAENLEERAGMAAGTARRLGVMNPIEQAMAVQSVRLLEQYGPQNLPPEIVQQALSIAPEKSGKLVEQAGARSRAFQELREVAPEDAAGSPEELRRQAAELRQQAAKREFDIDRTVARTVADSGRDLGEFFTATFRSFTDAVKREVENGLRIGKTN